MLLPCEACNTLSWDDRPDGYHCKGFIDGDSTCFVVTQTPRVKKFKLSADLKACKLAKAAVAKPPSPRVFLKEMVSQQSVIAAATAAAAVGASQPRKRPADNGAAAAAGTGPLEGIVVAVSGKLTMSVKQLKEVVTKLGGTFHTAATLGSFVTVLVTNLAEVGLD